MAKVIVTGANGGFGKLVVEDLLAKGHAVAATLRGVETRNLEAARELRRAGARVVELDVALDESVERGVMTAIRELGGLDVVVNNAGVGVLGAQEAFTPADLQRLFDVNVFGVHRVNRAALPLLRDQKKGTLIQVSSLLGRIAVPYYGPYNASKWALEALSENYRVELSQFGIDVCIVEPGGFPTTFIDNLMRPSDAARTKALGNFAAEAEGFLKGFEQALAANPAQDPRKVAQAIVELIDAPAGSRPFRTVVDQMGMGDGVIPYNEHLAKLTAGIYSSFGIGHLLELRR